MSLHVFVFSRGDDTDLEAFNMEEKDVDNVNFKAEKRSKKKKEGYDYQSTIQMLGKTAVSGMISNIGVSFCSSLA